MMLRRLALAALLSAALPYGAEAQDATHVLGRERRAIGLGLSAGGCCEVHGRRDGEEKDGSACCQAGAPARSALCRDRTCRLIASGPMPVVVSYGSPTFTLLKDAASASTIAS